MTKPLESFFDYPIPNYKLWQEPQGAIEISPADIVFQAPLSRICPKTGELRTNYFVLTKTALVMLESETDHSILSVLSTDWVRVDYITKTLSSSSEKLFVFRFVRNMRYTDLFTNDHFHF
jgi:hypothetical protein